MVFNSKVVSVFMLWLPKISGSSIVLVQLYDKSSDLGISYKMGC